MGSEKNSKKLRVAFLVGDFPAVSETFIFSQITNLIDLGHEVEIFALRRKREDKVQEDVEKYKILERTHFLNVPKSSLGKIGKALYLFFANIHKNPGNMIKSLSYSKYGKFSLGLNPFFMGLAFREHMDRFDVIHAHFGQRGALGIYLKDIGAKGGLVTTLYGGDVHKKYIQSYRHLFDKGDLFIVNNNFKKGRVVDIGGIPEKITIVPTGVILDKFKYKKRKIVKGGKVKLLTVGRLVEKKGIKYAIMAIAELVKKNKNIEYNIVGDGELRDELEALRKKLKVEEYVNFLGYKTQEEYIKLYDSSHIFLSPCVTASDGGMDQSLVNQEAQKAGVPIISTLHNGIPEGVLDGKSGFLVPEKDHKALAEKLEYLIKNQKEWSKMGKIGSDFVMEKYDQRKISEKIVDIYHSLARK